MYWAGFRIDELANPFGDSIDLGWLGLPFTMLWIAGIVNAINVRLYETFLAGCYEKVEELDGSSGNFGMFVDDLYAGWIKARQAAGADPDETAKWLLARMDDDPYGFTHQLEGDAAKVMNKASLAAFARHVRARFDGEPPRGPEGESSDADHARRRWSNGPARHLCRTARRHRVRHAMRRDGAVRPGLPRGRDPAPEAEARGGARLGRSRPRTRQEASPRFVAGHDLAKMRRELLTKLGRGSDALEEAWAEFHEHPSKYTYGVSPTPMAPGSQVATGTRGGDRSGSV